MLYRRTMILTGHGRLIGAIALAVLILLSLSPVARAQSPYGNVVELTLPRPAADEVVLANSEIEMTRRAARVAQLGSLDVRRAGGRLPRGYGVTAIQARPRGDRVIVRLVAVRASAAARPGRSLRVRLRIGTSRVVYRRATTTTFAIGPRTTVRGARRCGTIVGEASRWRSVRGLAGLGIGGERFGARTAVGAAQQIACRRRILSVPSEAAERFLVAVDDDFVGADGGGGSVEGFYATWARDAAGNARICVYARGDRGGEGDVTVASTTQRFTLDDTSGVARVDTPVAGEGEYAFVVRWRQPDGTYRESESTLRVPGGGTKGNDPPAPYSAAGTCG